MTIDTLLAPLPADVAGGAPCGNDLSFELEFDTIRELRREDDPTLSQGEWVTELKRADWPGVAAMCARLLGERSKDLRLVGWWLDAAGRTSGYAGLADGLDLAQGLCARYWPELHPRAEGGDWEQRVGNLAWLLGRVESMGKSAPILRSGDERYGLDDLRAARLRRGSANVAASSDEPATPTERAQRERDERVLRSLRSLAPAQLETMHRDAQRARAALGALEAIVDRELGQDGPAFAGARQALDEAVHELERLVRDAGGTAPAAVPTQAASIPTTRGEAAMNLPTGAPVSRAQALAQLRQVADFFRRTEPHSPVAYLADKAAQWGDMPLHTWLRSVMREPGALAHLEELLGIEQRRDAE